MSLSSGGITDELIANARIGISVQPDDIDGIKRAIVALAGRTGRNGDDVEIVKFSTANIFKNLASELLRLLDA